VVSANLDDVESLKKAFAGAHGVFAVTNFWEHFSAEKEKAQAKNIADAAKAAGVKHVIWSTSGRYRAVHERRRQAACRCCRRSIACRTSTPRPKPTPTSPACPATMLVTSFYWDNLFMFGLAPKKGDDGQYAWAFRWETRSSRALPVRTSASARSASFKGGDQYIGKTVGIAGEFLTIDQMGQSLAKNLGLGAVKYNAVEPDVYRSWGFPGADEMGNMFQADRDFEKQMMGNRNLEEARKLNPALQTFDQFVNKNKDKILAAANPAPAGTTA
jgi:hypothetical protein